MTNTLYIDCSRANEAEKLCNFLETQGYSFGYDHWTASSSDQRRAFSNMPYIKINSDKKLYSGSKGKSLCDNWVKFKNLKLTMFLAAQDNVNKGIVSCLQEEVWQGIEDREGWIEKRQKQIGSLQVIASKLCVVESNKELEALKYEIQRILR